MHSKTKVGLKELGDTKDKNKRRESSKETEKEDLVVNSRTTNTLTIVEEIGT